MKKYLLILISLGMLQQARAQFVVYDPANHAENIESLIYSTLEIFNHLQHLNHLQETLLVDTDSRDELIKKFNLQEYIREFSFLTHTVKNLKWSDLFDLMFYSLNYPEDWREKITHLPVDQLHNILNSHQSTLNKSLDLYGHLIGLDSRENYFTNYQDLKAYQQESAVSQFALKEAIDKKKIHRALINYNLAEDYYQKAIELQNALKKPERFAMTEAERLESLKLSRDYLLKSMKMNLEFYQGVQQVFAEKKLKSYHLRVGR